MTKLELIERVYRSALKHGNGRGLPSDLTKKTVQQVVDAVFDELSDYFVKAKVSRQAAPKFTWPGFGTFTKRRRGERPGRNPRTGDPITIPASTTLAFAPGLDLKSLLNKKT
jgi:nucleoid DNA-binding protein